METRPADLPDALVAEAVTSGWPVRSPRVAYLPVGFGSHHWSVEDAEGRRWFVSVDAAAPGTPDRTRLEAAFTTAALARDAGLPFVVAPLRSTRGRVVETLGGGYALALYPRVDGRTSSFYDDLDPATAHELVDRLAALHTDAERTGRPLQPALVECYRLAWALADVAERTADLRDSSAETADTATAWDALVGTLEALAARHTSPNSGRIVGQEVPTRADPEPP
jgi:spectinomycin phosphotransferase